MSTIPKTVLKAYFEQGDKPTQAQFSSLIDSSLNLLDDRKLLGFKVYSTTVGYEIGDITVYNGLAYEAIAITSGAFDPSKWKQLDLDQDVIISTHAELNDMRIAGILKPGQLYFINDRNIWIAAATSREFCLSGHYMAVNADYQNTGGNNVGVWTETLSGLVANTSVAIWDNLHWLNLTGDPGTQPNGDPLNWELRTPENDHTYITEIDAIKYDFILDFIFERRDKRGNVVSSMRDTDGELGSIPIEFFQWGRDGVDGNVVKNSVLNIINAVTPNFGIRATDFSFISIFNDVNCSRATFSQASLYLRLTTDLQRSTISNFTINAVNTVITGTGKLLEPGFSDFDASFDITGQISLDVNGFDFAGIYLLTSTNGAETIAACNSASSKHPFELRPSGMTLNITNGSGSPGEFALSLPNLLLDGNKGDFAKFRVDENGVVRLVEFMNYA